MFEKLDRDNAAQLAGVKLENLLKSFSAETNTPMDETRRAFEQVQASGGNTTNVQKDNTWSNDKNWEFLVKALSAYLKRELRRLGRGPDNIEDGGAPPPDPPPPPPGGNVRRNPPQRPARPEVEGEQEDVVNPIIRPPGGPSPPPPNNSMALPGIVNRSPPEFPQTLDEMSRQSKEFIRAREGALDRA